MLTLTSAVFLSRQKGSISSVLEPLAYDPNMFNIEWRRFSAAFRFAFVEFSMALELMEGSYYILLSCILLPCITAKTTDRLRFQTAFLNHTKVCQAMAKLWPEYSFPQASQGFVVSASQATGRIHSYPHPQGDRFPLDYPGICNLHTTDINENNLHLYGTRGLNNKLINVNPSTESVRGPDLSNLSVSNGTLATNDSTLDDSLRGQTVDNDADPHLFVNMMNSASDATFCNDVNFQGDEKWQQQLMAEAYGSCNEPPNTGPWTYLPADATSLGGLDTRGSSNQKDLASGTTIFNADNVPYPSPIHQSSNHMSSCNRLRPPPVSYDSYIFYPVTDPNPTEPSGTSVASCIPSTHVPAPNTINPNGLEASRDPTPVPRKRKYKKRKPSGASAPRKPAQQECKSNNLKHSCVSDQADDPDEDDIFKLYTTLGDHPQEDSMCLPPPDSCELSDVPAPNISSAVPEPGTKRKRTPNTNPNRVRKNRSTTERRTDPKERFFCIDTKCMYSQEQLFVGFPHRSEMERHLQSHRDAEWECSLKHKGDHQYFARKDGLRK